MENTNNTNIRTIKIHSQQINKDGKKFIASSAEIGGRWFKIKFTQECNIQPKTKGLYDLTFNFDDASVEAGKKYVKSNGESGVSPITIWVKNVIKLRKYTDEELREDNRAKLAFIFDGEVSGDELPL